MTGATPPPRLPPNFQGALRAVAIIWLLVILTVLVGAYVMDRSVDLNATVIGMILAGIISLIIGINLLPRLGGDK